MTNFEAEIQKHLTELNLIKPGHTLTREMIRGAFKKIANSLHKSPKTDENYVKMRNILVAKKFLSENLKAVNDFIVANDPQLKAAAERAKTIERDYIAALPPAAAIKYQKLKTARQKARFKKIRRITQKKNFKTLVLIGIGCALVVAILIVATIISEKRSAAMEAAYNNGMAAFEEKDYETAADYFKQAGSHEDAKTYVILSSAYQIQDTDPRAAALMLGQVETYEAFKESRSLFWKNSHIYNCVMMTDTYHAVLDKNGKVNYKYTGNDSYLDLTDEVSEWGEIIYIGGNNYNILGVTAEGKIVAEGSESYKIEKKTKKWRNIVSVYMCGDVVVGLRADGTIETTSDKGAYGEIRKWKNICDFDFDGFEYSDVHDTHFKHVFAGADIDGKVHVAAPDYSVFDSSIMSETAEWENIKAISISNARWIGCHVVGLKEDGTVLVSGTNHNNVKNVDDWENVVDIHSTSTYTYGITAEGKVLLAGADAFSVKDVSNVETAVCFIDIENFLALDKDGNFLCEKDKETFFSEWDGKVRVPKFN